MTETTWHNYEEVAAYLLDQNAEEFGLKKVEGKQSIEGKRSGTNWEIDAKGIVDKGNGFVLIECRRYTTSKQNQEKIGALAYRIIDTGAYGGIIVSPLGLQSGAKKVASQENIIEVILDANSTPQTFALRFLNKLMIGLSDNINMSDECSAVLRRKCKVCGQEFEVQQNEKICPKCSSFNTT